MAVAKPTISIDKDLYEQVKSLAEAEGISVSAFFSDAARRRVRSALLLQATGKWQAEHGAFTEEERAQARAELGLDRPAGSQPERGAG